MNLHAQLSSPMRAEGGALSDLLANLSILGIGIVLLLTMLVSAAAGRGIRKLQQRRSAEDAESIESVAQEGYLLGSALGLLGLLLAFSFGMVLNRYEQRRELVTTEANAIGTAYLRAQLLDEPHRTRLSRLLVAYTENRITLASSEGDRRAYFARNDKLLTDIWSAIRSARESALTHGLTTTLLASYNEVIDLDTERKVAWELRIPLEVAVLLILYLALTAGVAGHQVDGPRGKRAALVLFILLALSITVIIDLNRPSSGSARESQQAMQMLLESLKSQPPGAFDRFEAPPSRD
jgi:hypothetical protein